ncbi:hypothetical protein M513_00608 [Trichuris suis]|uniref:Uncharacterized protein n=1 Tax=Trichuris suis TaxID=68888 RepID=A0A085MMD6_9BILA|nr:hypothetical protein M513_00608 [Trichuris suis]
MGHAHATKHHLLAAACVAGAKLCKAATYINVADPDNVFFSILQTMIDEVKSYLFSATKPLFKNLPSVQELDVMIECFVALFRLNHNNEVFRVCLDTHATIPHRLVLVMALYRIAVQTRLPWWPKIDLVYSRSEELVQIFNETLNNIFHTEKVKFVSTTKMQFTGVQIISFLLLLAGTTLVITSIATSHWSYDSSGLGIGNVELLQNYRGLWEKCHRINVDLGSSGLGSSAYHCVNRFKAVFERASQGDFSRPDQDLQGEFFSRAFFPFFYLHCFSLGDSRLDSHVHFGLGQCHLSCVFALLLQSLRFLLDLLGSRCRNRRPIGSEAKIELMSLHFSQFSRNYSMTRGQQTGKIPNVFSLCTVAGVGTYAYEVYSTEQKGHEIASITHATVTFGWSYWIAVAGGCCQMLSAIGLGISRARHSSYSHVI